MKTGSIRNLAKTSENVSRNDSYTINPLIVKVDWEANPRKDYGSDEEFAELMNSIKTEGVKMPITGYVSSEGEVILTHGFRRMKAVLELINSGFEITGIPFRVGTANQESILLEHLVLNSGKPLTDIETSETLLTLMKLSGKEDYSALAKRVGMNYQKVYRLVNFAKNASSQVKDMVANNTMSITAAIDLVNSSESIAQQNETATQLKTQADSTGSKKIKAKSVAKANGKIVNKFDYLVDIIDAADDSDFTRKMKLILDAVSNGRNKVAILKMINQ